MYHFLHKHRYWFLGLVFISVLALVYFQFLGDPGPPVPRPAQPQPATTGQ